MDYIKDQTRGHLARICSLTSLPEFVKTAEITAESVAGLSPSAFADPVEREFPIDDPGRAFLSLAYMTSAGMTKQAKYQPVVARVKRACDLFGIEEAQLEVLKELDQPEVVKSAAAPKQYAYELDFGAPNPEGATAMEKNGGVHGFYPISTASEIEAAGTTLDNERRVIGLPAFVSACRNVVKAAKAKSVDLSLLPPSVVHYGDEREIDTGYIIKCAEVRTRMTGNPIYVEMAQSISSGSAQEPDAWVELWQQADRMHKVAYTATVPDPYRVFYSGQTKDAVAADAEQWIIIADCPVPRAELGQVKRASVEKYFAGPDQTALMELVNLQLQGLPKTDLVTKVASLSPQLQKAFVRLIVGKNPRG